MDQSGASAVALSNCLSVEESYSIYDVVKVLANKNSVPECSVYSPGRFSNASPIAVSPWNNIPSKSKPSEVRSEKDRASFIYHRCISSKFREGGHIFSLAAANGLLYTGSASKTIRVWRYPELFEYSQFKSGSGNVNAILLSQDKIFSAHKDHKIRVWRRSQSNLSIHKRFATLPTLKDSLQRFLKQNAGAKHSDVISSLAYNAVEGLLYSGSWDKSVKVWRMCDLKCVETIHAHEEPVNVVLVGADGLLYTASEDCTVKIWKYRNLIGRAHMLTKTLRVRNSPVKALALSADGCLYAGLEDGNIGVWEKDQFSGRMLRGHRHAVLCVATMGDLVLSGSADGTIRVWMREMESFGVHTCLAVMAGHVGPVKCIAATFEDVNQFLVFTGSTEGVVMVWRVTLMNKVKPAGVTM